ncbi:SDR family NAD(P)-dependent oxidoreductase [Pedobacter caeni]|uniref:NAD(P)-dependent dehydrogenase, short-chain alcohol dehydrogenase family n=1 Tax=Pedobacter caeni TaxID=288992 RepID=A0A1M5GDV6_9SPHI|nr:SDR family oxidoreductase [Pedobacter caeni]SHG01904.1 NAD(P)-dependent dehydrogenase, short-chain alcohol dehydrogenase family [Pedobacter caeni]
MALQIDLKGKNALVTGVSSGIGLGVAKMLARAGCRVTGCALAEADHAAVSLFLETLKKEGTEGHYIQADVRKPEELEQLVAQTTKTGGIDILVSNAGKNFFEGAAECGEEEWQENMDLNLTAHWRLAKLCRPYLEQSKGMIIIMTSNHAYHTIPGCFPYNVAKTALTGLVNSLTIEWGPAIRCVGIAPGFIDTPGNQDWFNSFDEPELERQRTIDLHPVKRLGTPEEIGGWCVFLASEYAAFASGTTYLIDGGRNALMQDH